MSQEEQRNHPRFSKQFTVGYRLKNGGNPDKSTIKDISKGGLKFTASQPIAVNEVLVLELAIPYLAPNKTVLEAVVVDCFSKAALIHEIRVKFVNVPPAEQRALEMIEAQSKGVK